jgi:hypothetical protein
MVMVVVVMTIVVMIVSIGQMHVELHAFDAGFLLARKVHVIAVELELLEFRVPACARPQPRSISAPRSMSPLMPLKNVEVDGFSFMFGGTCYTNP